MYSPPRPGEWITHPAFGPGEVVRLIRGGRYLLVRFQGRAMLTQVRPEELQAPVAPRPGRSGPPPGPAALPTRPAPPRPRPDLLPPGEEGDRLALQVLEALRLGVVPPHLTELYTVGREREMALVEADLAETRQTGSARVVLGDYGSGKTHLLECIESLALRAGFLVSRITLDGEEVAPSHPKRVFHALVGGLNYPDIPGAPGLEPLLDKACQSDLEGWLTRGGPGYHHYLSPVLAYYRELRQLPQEQSLRETLLDWIEGHPSVSNLELEPELRRTTHLRHRLYALMDHRTLAHLYTYIVGGLCLLARHTGYAGLVLLFDEAEFYGVLSSASREFADLLFGYYASAALGPGRSPFDLEGAFRGGQAVHRSFPPLFSWPQNLYCVFAMTEDPVGLRALARSLPDDRFVRLRPLGLGDYQELCRRVLTLYRRAYADFRAADQVEQPMGEIVYEGVEKGHFENPRQVLKFVLELLDFSRLCRERISQYVRELREHLRD
jgi:hypothetical protein